MKLKIVTLVFLFLSLPVFAEQARELQIKPSVVSVVPILDLIATSLLASTPVETIYFPPKRLPINRIPAWLNRNANSKIIFTDAVLTIESVWKELSIFPLLRQKNIRLVMIDLAQEIAPGGAGISQREGISEPDYFWLENNNLLMMVNVAAKDLSRLWPEHSEEIRKNHRQALIQIQQTALQIDDVFMAKNINSLAVLDDKLTPLAQSTILPLVEVEKADLLLSSKTVQKLSRGKETDNNQKIWVIDPLLKPSQKSLNAWLISLVDSLKTAVSY